MSALQNVCDRFSVSSLEKYFRSSIPSFKPDEVSYDFLFDDNDKIQVFFTDIQKLGEADLPNGEDLFVFSALTKFSLTERSSKKQQYDIAKKLLKEEVKDAAFFIFYDDKGQFRFSFIRADFKGTKREYSTFRRYTYFVSPSQTNQTFIRQLSVCNFQDLDDIQNAFSVEPLNKEFYQKIAKTFYQLIGGKVSEGSKAKEYNASLKLPSLDSKKNHRTYQEFAVRFIGRTIFIWFLKNKTSDAGLPLIPTDWLTSVKVGSTKDYYHNLLEKLFFEILNTPISERMEGLPEEHTIVPFLNGGLFEPQHDDFYEAGFNGFSKYHNTLKVPDSWIKNLFETLEQFNFTIDENTLTDMEVSIDPEMLGTIFENLLAEIDPDTEKSARKSTGSFYTPREIVDYMVVESLVAYLETKTELNEHSLRPLFLDGELHKECDKHKEELIDAFDTVKILDPACGSGAFPMGALHKINMALQKLDPDAEVWKEKQLAKIENVAYRNALKDKLDKSNVEYVRKIGIIQHSIYGVDIQPIATEISKLRSFLSLVVDENIDDSASNRGIYPLPNLEFKFVTANTLVSLKTESVKSKSQTGAGFDFGGVGRDIEALQETRDQYLQSYGQEKEQLKERFLKIQKQIAQKEFSSSSSGGNVAAQQIIGWNPFSHEKSDWFVPKWMFGLKHVDIIIGNPPYISTRNQAQPIRDHLRDNLNYSRGADVYVAFIEVSLTNFLNTSGICTLIVPNKFFGSDYGTRIRTYLHNNANIYKIYDLKDEKVFKSAQISTIVISVRNKPSESYNCIVKTRIEEIEIKDLYDSGGKIQIEQNNRTTEIVKKLSRNKVLADFCTVRTGIMGFEYWKMEPIIFNDMGSNKDVPILTNGNIEPYIDVWDSKEITLYKTKYFRPTITLSKKYLNGSTIEFFKTYPKVIVRGVAKKLTACIDNAGYAMLVAVHGIIPEKMGVRLLLAILNSALANWYHIMTYYSQRIPQGSLKYPVNFIQGIPVPELDSQDLNSIEVLVDDILAKRSAGERVNEEQAALDLLIFRLYGLSYDDVKIIVPDIEIDKKGYESYTYE